MAVAGSEPAGSAQVTAGTITTAPAQTGERPLPCTDLHKQCINQRADPSMYLLVWLSLLRGSDHRSSMKPFLIHPLSLLFSHSF